MNRDSTPPLELIHTCLDGRATDGQRSHLAALLRSDPVTLDLYLQLADLHACLAVDEQLWVPEVLPVGTQALRAEPQHRPWRATLLSRPYANMAAGLLIGLFLASVIWGLATPRAVATASQVPTLLDGSFEATSGPLMQGFPLKPGVWSGDEAEITAATANDGRQALRFVKAGSDPAGPPGEAGSCDVFQLVDLRTLRPRLSTRGEAVLELSAEFLETRLTMGVQERFACHLYLFEGDPALLHSTWPQMLNDAVGSGVSQTLTRGGKLTATTWKRVTVRCVLPATADFAVVQISAGRVPRAGYRMPELGTQFADNVRLTLKTQPVLPVHAAIP